MPMSRFTFGPGGWLLAVKPRGDMGWPSAEGRQLPAAGLGVGLDRSIEPFGERAASLLGLHLGGRPGRRGIGAPLPTLAGEIGGGIGPGSWIHRHEEIVVGHHPRDVVVEHSRPVGGRGLEVGVDRLLLDLLPFLPCRPVGRPQFVAAHPVDRADHSVDIGPPGRAARREQPLLEFRDGGDLVFPGPEQPDARHQRRQHGDDGDHKPGANTRLRAGIGELAAGLRHGGPRVSGAVVVTAVHGGGVRAVADQGVTQEHLAVGVG